MTSSRLLTLYSLQCVHLKSQILESKESLLLRGDLGEAVVVEAVVVEVEDATSAIRGLATGDVVVEEDVGGAEYINVFDLQRTANLLLELHGWKINFMNQATMLNFWRSRNLGFMSYVMIVTPRLEIIRMFHL